MKCVFAAEQRLHNPRSFIVAGKPAPMPESVERIDMLLEGLALLNLSTFEPEPVNLQELERVHTPRYLEFLQTLRQRWSHQREASDYPIPNVHALGRDSLPPPNYPDSVVGQVGWHFGDGSAPFGDGTLEAALASAATAKHAAGLVAEGERLAYALCRPPGHHASADMAAGFCYFNNAAFAAAHLRELGHRVAILDIDVHHGNGTQAIFYCDPTVLTASIHVDPARFYPFFWGYAHERGYGPGEGSNLNLPLARGTIDVEFLDAVDAALESVKSHHPDILVLAAGLDTAEDDPFKGFAVTRAGFERIGKRIRAADLPVVAIQEGGYPSPSLAGNLAALLSGLGA
jgi:acetoin utilization deacetylase AcuC-like enzyme